MQLDFRNNCEQLFLVDAPPGNEPITIYVNDFVTPVVSPDEGFNTGTVGTGVGITTEAVGMSGYWEGVIMVVAGNEVAYGVAKCDIDCCLAKKMDAYLSNDCQCVQCDKELETMNKIFLLMISAISSTVVLNNPELNAATRKYLKAKELCNLGNCKCNC